MTAAGLPTVQGPGTRKLPRLWRGYLTGTNRGRLWLRMKEGREGVRGCALFLDQMLGQSVIRLEGSRSDRNVELRILSFQSLAPLAANPLDGRVKFELAEDLKSATGTWHTDIGTNGSGSVSLGGLPGSFQARLAAARLRFFWRRHLPSLYTLLVGLLVALAASERAKLSTPILILILVPAPYVFRRHIAELIHAFRLRRLGPVEFREQGPVSAEVRAAISTATQEAVRFALTDGYFVPRTKQVLLSLVQSRTLTRPDFEKLCAGLGITDENVEATWQALLVAGCATVDERGLTNSPYGLRYAQHLLGLA